MGAAPGFAPRAGSVHLAIRIACHACGNSTGQDCPARDRRAGDRPTGACHAGDRHAGRCATRLRAFVGDGPARYRPTRDRTARDRAACYSPTRESPARDSLASDCATRGDRAPSDCDAREINTAGRGGAFRACAPRGCAAGKDDTAGIVDRRRAARNTTDGKNDTSCFFTALHGAPGGSKTSRLGTARITFRG